jgi:hypothetical protein
MDERYECPTCCYATNSYTKFLAHGKEHSLENRDKELPKVYIVLVSYEHYDNEENYQGSDEIIKGVFSTRQKAESLAGSINDATVKGFALDAAV